MTSGWSPFLTISYASSIYNTYYNVKFTYILLLVHTSYKLQIGFFLMMLDSLRTIREKVTTSWYRHNMEGYRYGLLCCYMYLYIQYNTIHCRLHNACRTKQYREMHARESAAAARAARVEQSITIYDLHYEDRFRILDSSRSLLLPTARLQTDLAIGE